MQRASVETNHEFQRIFGISKYIFSQRLNYTIEDAKRIVYETLGKFLTIASFDIKVAGNSAGLRRMGAPEYMASG